MSVSSMLLAQIQAMNTDYMHLTGRAAVQRVDLFRAGPSRIIRVSFIGGVVPDSVMAAHEYMGTLLAEAQAKVAA